MPVKRNVVLFLLLFWFSACGSTNPVLLQYGRHYQKHRDYASLSKVVELLPLNSSKSLVIRYLGDPIDFGFDYRYLLDSMGVDGCVIGAVFHFNDRDAVDQKWLDQICE
ncbi:MAG: hypothetical protein ACFCUI_10750 [Bernardetiaceae bacterium]